MPVLFWQVRGGYLGRKIAVYKYRTLKAPFTASGKPVDEERRLSFVGRFLRRTHLDELPQLVGVLKGDM
jgi:lipopolysaccharide/colanic/teichoic acid biosynthesis glycosyltransferase